MIVVPFLVGFLRKRRPELGGFLLYFFISAAAGLIIFNNLPIDWPVKSASVETNIRGWLDKTNFSIRNNPHDDARFQFLVTDQQNNSFAIINRKDNDPSEIIIATTVVAPDKFNEAFKRATKYEQLKFVNYIGSELLKFGVNFKDIKLPLKSFELEYTIHINKSTTRIEFLHEIFLLRRASYYAQNILLAERLRIENNIKK